MVERLAVAPGTVRLDADIRFLGADPEVLVRVVEEARFPEAGVARVDVLEEVPVGRFARVAARARVLALRFAGAAVRLRVVALVLRFAGAAVRLRVVALVLRFAGVVVRLLPVVFVAPEAFRAAGVARRLVTVRFTVVGGRDGAARWVVPDAVAVAVVRFTAGAPLREVVRFVDAAPAFMRADVPDRLARGAWSVVALRLRLPPEAREAFAPLCAFFFVAVRREPTVLEDFVRRLPASALGAACLSTMERSLVRAALTLIGAVPALLTVSLRGATRPVRS